MEGGPGSGASPEPAEWRPGISGGAEDVFCRLELPKENALKIKDKRLINIIFRTCSVDDNFKKEEGTSRGIGHKGLAWKLSTTLQSFSFDFCLIWGKFQPWNFLERTHTNPENMPNLYYLRTDTALVPMRNGPSLLVIEKSQLSIVGCTTCTNKFERAN